jgi:hypothetical protein
MNNKLTAIKMEPLSKESEVSGPVKVIDARIEEVIELHEKIAGRTRKTLKDMVRVGELLKQIKDSLPHGGWTELFECKVLPFTIRSAQRYLYASANRHRIKSLKHDTMSLVDPVDELLTLDDAPTEEQKPEAEQRRKGQKQSPPQEDPKDEAPHQEQPVEPTPFADSGALTEHIQALEAEQVRIWITEEKSKESGQPETFDYEGCAQHIKRLNLLRSFRDLARSRGFQEILPINQQAEAAEHVVRAHAHRELNSDSMRIHMSALLQSERSRGWHQNLTEQRAIEDEEVQRKWYNLQSELAKYIRCGGRTAHDMKRLLEEHQTEEFIFSVELKKELWSWSKTLSDLNKKVNADWYTEHEASKPAEETIFELKQ